MSRASWGGQQDLSGLFSSLLNENFNQIRAGINEALGNARDEQSAKDQRMQAKWTAGKISDEKWLEYIRSRIADSTDPQERSQWQQILLQNQDAISDAQWETKFQQNKITVGQLLGHYRSRMGDVRTNSPAYRELASRQSELLQFQRSGGVYYNDQYKSSGGSGGGSRGGSSGGGSGGGSGSGRGGLQALLNKDLKGGPTDAGYTGGDIYNTRGPTVSNIEFGQPATSSRASLFATVTDGLLGTQKQLNGFFDFLHNNPNAKSYTIPGTGMIIPINAKTVRMYDNQWLRVTKTLADVYHKKGDISEAKYQESLIGDHVTVTMPEHNMRFADQAQGPENSDSLGLWLKRRFALMNNASTPQERSDIASETGTMYDKWVKAHNPSAREVVGGFSGGQATVTGIKNAPTEDQLPPGQYQSHQTVRVIIDMIAHPENYSDEDVNRIFDTALENEDIGVADGKIHIADLMGNGSNQNSTLGDGALGAGDFREQAIGLRVADMITSGQISPDDPDIHGVPLFAYQWNQAAGRMEPAPAVATPQPDGSFDVVPGVVDGNGNLSPAPNATAYISNVNGKPTKVWTPVITSPPANGYIYRFGSDMTIDAGGKQVSFKKGDVVPSSVLSGLGSFNLNAYVSSGRLYKDAPPGISQAMVNGRTWYFDIRLGTWSPDTPWEIEPDKTDPNAIHVNDMTYVKSADGSWTVLPADKAKGESTFILDPPKSGVQGFPMPYDTNMTTKQMQAWVDEQVALGNIAPGEYRYMDGDGNMQTMTAEDLGTSYYDPVVEAHKQTLRQATINRVGNVGIEDAATPDPGEDARLVQQAKSDLYFRRFTQDRQAAASAQPLPQVETPDTDARLRALEQRAATLGIRTGVLPGQSQPPTVQQPQGMDDSMLRRAALIAAQNRVKIAQQPRLEPLPVKPPPVEKPKVAPVHAPPIDILTGNRNDRNSKRKSRQTVNFQQTKADHLIGLIS